MSKLSNAFYSYLETLKEYNERMKEYGSSWVQQKDVVLREDDFLEQLSLALKKREKSNEQ